MSIISLKVCLFGRQTICVRRHCLGFLGYWGGTKINIIFFCAPSYRKVEEVWFGIDSNKWGALYWSFMPHQKPGKEISQYVATHIKNYLCACKEGKPSSSSTGFRVYLWPSKPWRQGNPNHLRISTKQTFKPRWSYQLIAGKEIPLPFELIGGD